MADFFPFVTLPKDVPCRDLVIQRPVLTLAVITAATSESISLQMTLSREFRKVIMVKIMNGQKDLDVLQGILVFLAWHHHYMDAQSVSIPMLLQLAIGMAHDLGLDNISHATRSPLFKGDPREREAKRAYLGCYYLAASLSSLEPGKTRPISYTSNLRRYAADLATAWDHKSDAVLPVLIDMCQFTEDVEETFQASSEQALVARSQVKRLSDKWEHIRAATKILATNFSEFLI